MIDMNRLVDGSDDVAGFSFYPAENPDFMVEMYFCLQILIVSHEFYGLR